MVSQNVDNPALGAAEKRIATPYEIRAMCVDFQKIPSDK